MGFSDLAFIHKNDCLLFLIVLKMQQLEIIDPLTRFFFKSTDKGTQLLIIYLIGHYLPFEMTKTFERTFF